MTMLTTEKHQSRSVLVRVARRTSKSLERALSLPLSLAMIYTYAAAIAKLSDAVSTHAYDYLQFIADVHVPGPVSGWWVDDESMKSTVAGALVDTSDGFKTVPYTGATRRNGTSVKLCLEDPVTHKKTYVTKEWVSENVEGIIPALFGGKPPKATHKLSGMTIVLSDQREYEAIGFDPEQDGFVILKPLPSEEDGVGEEKHIFLSEFMSEKGLSWWHPFKAPDPKTQRSPAEAAASAINIPADLVEGMGQPMDDAITAVRSLIGGDVTVQDLASFTVALAGNGTADVLTPFTASMVEPVPGANSPIF